MLAGLCHWHTKTQEILKEVISELHLLEQVASDQHIGTLAENLLEVVAEHPPCYEEVGLMRWHLVVRILKILPGTLLRILIRLCIFFAHQSS